MKRLRIIPAILFLLVLFPGCAAQAPNVDTQRPTAVPELAEVQKVTPEPIHETTPVTEAPEASETTAASKAPEMSETSEAPEIFAEDTGAQEDTAPILPDPVVEETPAIPQGLSQLTGVWSLCHEGDGDVLLLTLNEDGSGSVETYYGTQSLQWYAEGSDLVASQEGKTERIPFALEESCLRITLYGSQWLFQPRH